MLAAALAGAVTLGVCVALWWPVALHLDTWHPSTPFGDSHTWVFEWIRTSVLGGQAPRETAAVGYPYLRDARPIALVPAAIYAVLRVVLPPVATGNLIQLCSLPVSAIAAFFLIRRWTAADPWTAAAAATAWALGPTLLSTLGMGEISNTQAWILPVFLLVLDGDDDRRLFGLPVVVALSAVTSPYYALSFPLIAVGRALFVRTRRSALAVVLVGLGLLPAWALYSTGGIAPAQQVFQPAHFTHAEDLPEPAPVARPDALLLGWERREDRPEMPSHIAYLGIVMVIAGVAGGARGGRGARPGAALAIGGVALALGPQLAVGDDYVRVAGWPVPLPVMLLEIAGYPTKSAGLYFRYAVLAELGLAVLMASALAGRPRAAGVAWLVTALAVADAIRETGPLWPRPSAEIADRAWLEGLRGTDGAVLELPIPGERDVTFGQAGLLRAVIHGRPTSSLPRGQLGDESQTPLILDALRQGDPDARRELSRVGYRYVILDPTLAPGDPLSYGLGPPDHQGALWGWDLGKTRLKVVDRLHLRRPARGRR